MNNMNMVDHLNELGTLAAGQHVGVLARILDPEPGDTATATVQPAAPAPAVAPIAPVPDWVALTVVVALALAVVAVAISTLVLLSSGVVRALAASLAPMRDPSTPSVRDIDVDLAVDLDGDLDLVENGW
jgi:hypothetical protein